MPNRIWKYTLPTAPGDHLWTLPIGARILSVQEQAKRVVMWVLLDPSADMSRPYDLRVVTTGENVPDSWLEANHLATIPLLGGSYVLHYFLRQHVTETPDA